MCKIKYELNPLHMYVEVYRWDNMVSTVWKRQISGILIISCHSSFPIVHNKIKLWNSSSLMTVQSVATCAFILCGDYASWHYYYYHYTLNLLSLYTIYISSSHVLQLCGLLLVKKQNDVQCCKPEWRFTVVTIFLNSVYNNGH